MKLFKVVKKRTEVLTKDIESEDEVAALRLFKDYENISDRSWENEMIIIREKEKPF